MSPVRKRIAILIVLVGSALLAERLMALASADDTEVVQPVVPKRVAGGVADAARAASAKDAAALSAAPPGRLRLDRLDARLQALSDSADSPAPTTPRPALFDIVSWQPPAPKAAAAQPPAAPPKPVAPPFAYVYMGGLTDNGVRTSFFTKGERVIAVKAGDTIDAAYRIDQMTEKQMTLTYLPLNETLVLALGGGR